MNKKQSKYIIDDVIQDQNSEGLAIGMILNNPKILNEYNDLISSKYDFANNEFRFLYDVLVKTYMNNTTVSDISINIEINKLDSESQELYYELGGFEIFRKCSKIAKVNTNFEKIYSKLKTFNLLRNLHNKGYNVIKNLDILTDKNVDEIIKIYEANLLKACSYIKGINDSILLGKDALDVYEERKRNPDFGIDMPFPIYNSLTRGWQKGCIHADAMHSGHGKSRKAIYMAVHISIIGNEPILIGVNEQRKSEIDLMLLTCVANVVFAEKYGMTINETEIAMGECTGVKDEMMRDAAKYIEENSKIHFLELNFWDLETLKVILKKHKLRGINYAIIDTFKAMRGMGMHDGMKEYARFCYTVEMLKKIIGSEEVDGLDMGIWLTLQMTDDSLISKTLNSTATAFGKQIKHEIDALTFSRRLDYKDKENIKVKLNSPNNPFDGQIQELNQNKNYYLTALDKNRRGVDKQHLIYEVDPGLMLFQEIGNAVYSKGN